jgi:hypothetical protein
MKAYIRVKDILFESVDLTETVFVPLFVFDTGL